MSVTPAMGARETRGGAMLTGRQVFYRGRRGNGGGGFSPVTDIRFDEARMPWAAGAMLMRPLPILFAGFLAALTLSAAAFAQESDGRSTTSAFITRGQALLSLRQVLDVVTANEPGARSGEFQLSLVAVGDTGSVHVFRFMPAPPNVVSTDSHRYHAAIVGGVVQRPQLVENYDVLRNVEGSAPSLVEGPSTSVSLNGDTLVEIEEALSAVRSRYHVSIQMSDVIVSYTSVRSTDREARATYGMIVFVTPSDASRDYTVLTRNGAVERTYHGIATPADWLNSEYWLNRR